MIVFRGFSRCNWGQYFPLLCLYAFHRPARHSLFISYLLFADFVHALGILIQARWLQLGGIHEGTVCSMQAVLISFGVVSGGIWSASLLREERERALTDGNLGT